ncbi:MAG: phospholipase D-like domain-containing protein [bacterium]
MRYVRPGQKNKRAYKLICLFIAFILSCLLCFCSILPGQKLKGEKNKVFFSPKGGIGNELCEKIDQASQLISLAVFSFTSRKIAQRLVAAHQRGVNVRIVIDKNQATDSFSNYLYLKDKGIPVKLKSGLVSPKREHSMHNKFMLIDNKILFTGSYNFTVSAEYYNYENILELFDLNIIRSFKDEFERLWDEN